MEGSITLYELQRRIKQAIDSQVGSVWIMAEISDIKVNSTGHCYMELVEKSEKNSAIPKAKASAVVWRSTYELLRPYFYEQTSQHLSVGMKVLLYVTVSYHELYGLSLVIKDIDPTYTLGDLERQKQLTIKQLHEDGVFDMNRQFDLPLIIERVAIISSATAAGYGDFIRHITENEYGYTFRTTLFPALVQGDGAENSIISALINISDNADDFDAVIIIRGGGSQSDMACFNNYLLCSYIAQFPLPIITGIGHDKDSSVADLVAHTSLKTPTAVANFLVDKKHDFELMIDGSMSAIIDFSNKRIKNENNRITTYLSDLKLLTKERVHNEQLNISNYSSNIKLFVRRRIDNNYSILQSYNKDIFNISLSVIKKCNRDIDDFVKEIKDNSSSFIKDKRQNISILDAKINSFNPRHILKLGFSIVTIGGKSLRSSNNLNCGDYINIKLSDGEAEAVIKGVKKYGNNSDK